MKKNKIGPAWGVLFFLCIGAGMIAYGMVTYLADENWVPFTGFGFLNLLLTFCFYDSFFTRKRSGSKMPIMRERPYGPSGDKKSIIHQKLPPI
jgi:intracellular septation protein A